MPPPNTSSKCWHRFQHWTYRFLEPGQDWDRGVDVTLGPAGNRKFEAWALEPRPDFEDVPRPKLVPKPGAERPEEWDEEEDGEWEPPLVKNPERNKGNTKNRKRRITDEDELEDPPFVATATGEGVRGEL